MDSYLAQIVLKKVVRNIDLISALGGIVFGLVIIALYFIYQLNQISIGLIIFIVSLIHILFRKNLSNERLDKIIDLHANYRIILNISIYLLILISFSIFQLSLNFRPLSYFIVISAAFSLIALSIFITNSKLYILFGIAIFSLLFRACFYYNFPSLSGVDAYTHAKIIELLISSGHVPPIELSSKYFYYPIFHIFIGMTEILSNLALKDSIFISVGIASVLCLTLIFLVNCDLANFRVGLMAVLMANFTNVLINRGVANISPDSLVISYLLVFLLLVLKRKYDIRLKFLILFISFIIMLTHPLSNFIMLFIITIFLSFNYALSWIMKSSDPSSIDLIEDLRGKNELIKISLAYVLLFVISTIYYWMNTFVTPSQTFFEFIINPLIDVLRTGGEQTADTLITGYDYQRPFFETVILYSSYLVLPFLSIGGLFLWLGSNHIRRLQYATLVAAFFLVIYGLPLLAIDNLLTDRWVPFAAIFLVMAASTYLSNVIHSIRRASYKLLFLFLICFIFSFLMITTPGVDQDNPIIAKETTSRNQFKDNEIMAIRTLSSKYDGNFITDESFKKCISFYRLGNSNQTISGLTLTDIESEIVNRKGSYIVLFRFDSLNNPVIVKYASGYDAIRTQTIPKQFFRKLECSTYNLIYNNDNIYCFQNRPS